MAADAARHNRLTVHGWIVLRFSDEAVMGDPSGVAATLHEAVALANVLKEVTRSGCAQA
ncbi:DUF559 domain-containing protein [Nocardioides sp. R-C-SC26]|uniref:DUF559 domain-containing protein n=1 Tax=Nocardioides sp. R-C-SC26 TaxID=2870414 RepID=UPI001E34B5FF|nr:DUF559 domain-containing protein [Nocardioides sp. R-C-SC26]